MTSAELVAWQQLPPIVQPAPILALATGSDGMWAGGIGGVAWCTADGVWQARVSGLHLSAVSVLWSADRWLLAGGVEGIARSSDGGTTWQLATIAGKFAPIAALIASPRFAEDGIALAATVGDGLLRSDDGGRSWRSANFGLQDFEVTTLAWGAAESVVAGTASGLYHSPNGGRAWRAVPGTEGLPIAALSALPDGSVIAAREHGGLLQLPRAEDRWQVYGEVAEDVLATTLLCSSDGVLLGTAGHGLLHSTDNGSTWTQVATVAILALAARAGHYYAGTANGALQSSDAGRTWQPMAVPPINDFRQLLVAGDALLVAGAHSGTVHYLPSTGWEVLQGIPSPLGSLAVVADGSIWASGPAGLDHLPINSAQWQTGMFDAGTMLHHLSFDQAGQGWASSADAMQLYRTQNGGMRWETLPVPWSGQQLLTLTAAPGLLLAGTYDEHARLVRPWRSLDAGQSWTSGNPLHTPWPLMATFDAPPLITLGNMLHVQQGNGKWQQVAVGPSGSAVRRVVGNEQTLLALTTEGCYRSDDQGVSWMPYDDELPPEQLIDIALKHGVVHVLLAGGQVWTQPLAQEA